MLDRKTLMTLFIGGMFVTVPTTGCAAQAHQDNAPASASSVKGEKEENEKDEKDEKDKGDKKHDAEDEKDEKHEHAEKKEKKEIEQPVQLGMVPTAVLDAVKKEVSGGTITEAALEAEDGKIMYTFDVKAGDTAYDVKITVDGKFYSKKVEDEKDEKPEAGEKK